MTKTCLTPDEVATITDSTRCQILTLKYQILMRPIFTFTYQAVTKYWISNINLRPNIDFWWSTWGQIWAANKYLILLLAKWWPARWLAFWDFVHHCQAKPMSTIKTTMWQASSGCIWTLTTILWWPQRIFGAPGASKNHHVIKIPQNTAVLCFFLSDNFDIQDISVMSK